jgi:uroporphyrinogen III methyltransferase/synthase
VFGIDPAATYFVTRPRPDTESACVALRERGLIAVAYPVLAIEPVDDTTKIARTMATIEDYGLVVFVSPNAIRQSLPHRAPIRPASRVGSPSSARFDSESLFAQLDAELGLSRGFDRPVLIVRGNGGRPWLADRLRDLGLGVEEIESYRRVTPKPDADGSSSLAQVYAAGTPAVFVVTSSDAVERLLECVVASLEGTAEAGVARDWARRAVVVTQHPRIVETAGRCGFTRVMLVNPDELGSGAGIE